MVHETQRETLEQQAHTIQQLEFANRTKYDSILEAQDRATRAEEQTKLTMAAARDNAANELKMARLLHEESMARQIQMAAENERQANTSHNHQLQEIHAQANLAAIEKEKRLLAEKIDQQYRNADEMKLHGDNIASLGPNSIVNHGVPRISATEEPLPSYHNNQDYHLNHALAVQEQINPPNMFGGSGAQAAMNIQRAGGMILPPSKLKQGKSSGRLAKIKTAGLGKFRQDTKSVKHTMEEPMFPRNTKRSRK